jgi:hypothetical protein
VISPVWHGIELGRLGFVRKRHKDVARATGNPTRATRTAAMRRRRRDDAATRQGRFGEVARATGCTESTTNSMGVLLTPRCSSLAASRRRNDIGGKESKAAAARVSGGSRQGQRAARVARVGGPGGAARLK